MTTLLERAQGCLLGQLAGDSLGSQVEFMSDSEIRLRHPHGLRLLAVSPVWHTLPGQPTDDSELALALARSIVAENGYPQEAAARAYVDWYQSQPFDIGGATSQALGSVSADDLLTGRAAATANARGKRDGQANGSLMRISPLGIWGASVPADQLAEHARADSQITHPNRICQEACAVYTVAIAHAIATGPSPATLYEHALGWTQQHGRELTVSEALRRAADEPPADFLGHAGWVLIALQNAFYQLVHAPDLVDGVVSSVMSGGDTDTNAAIAGALLGAVYGRDAIPFQWQSAILSCRPLAGAPGVLQPRPERFWPVDALELAERLLAAR
jgi:ADP-ribosyl-[dinitrogen reductase] hydrolase